MKTARLLCAIALSLGILLPMEAARADDGSVAVRIEVEKQLEGDVPSDAEEYSFVLEGEEGVPLPDRNMVTIIGEGTASFSEIVFVEPGTYRYTARELVGSSEGCSYDPSVYDVEVQVTTDDEGNLSAAVWAVKQGETCKSEEILFVNRYESPVEEEKDEELFGFLPTTGDFSHAALGILAAIALSASAVAALARRGSSGR